jgi:hypothetical protein
MRKGLGKKYKELLKPCFRTGPLRILLVRRLVGLPTAVMKSSSLVCVTQSRPFLLVKPRTSVPPESAIAQAPRHLKGISNKVADALEFKT